MDYMEMCLRKMLAEKQIYLSKRDTLLVLRTIEAAWNITLSMPCVRRTLDSHQ